MQMVIPPTMLRRHQRILREIDRIWAKFSFQKNDLGTLAVLESVLGKSSAIPVCLSESCLSHDVTRALRYFQHAPSRRDTGEHEIEVRFDPVSSRRRCCCRATRERRKPNCFKLLQSFSECN